MLTLITSTEQVEPAMISFDPFDEHGEVTDDFIRGGNIIRCIGWGVFSPVLFFSFHLAQAADYWFVIVGLTCYVYPALMAWLSKSASYPLKLTFGGLILESVALMLFSEVVGLDTVFLMVCFIVMVFNAGSIAGIRGSLWIAAVMFCTIALIQGELRAVETVTLSREIHLFMVTLLGVCVALLTNQTFLLLKHQVRLKREILEQKKSLEALNTHLVDTITNPFLSDEEILTHIGPTLDDEHIEQYRRRIRSRQAFESLGRRAPSIVHDAKNLLHPMSVLAELLRIEVDGNEEAHDMLADFDSAAHRLHLLLEQFERPHVSNTQPDTSSALQEVVLEVYSLLRASSPEGITLDVTNELKAGSDHLAIDETSLHRVISNICINGIHAMNSEGALSLHLRPSNPEESSRVHRQEGCVTVSISDQGVGMNEEVKQNLFTPYFTTRKDEGGTGLGLANAHAIVSEAGGVIIVESELGVGTTFRLVFPTQQSAPPPSRAG